MFTGIVEEIGRVRSVQRRTGYQKTDLDARRVLEEIQVGDSITLDGACHTVVAFDNRGFVVESVEETLQRTTLGRLQAGSRVNLERSIALGGRLDGHLVAGHIDGMGKVLKRQESSDNVLFQIGMSPDLAPYVAQKGSIAVDGISLTVVSVSNREFTVAVIPHTLQVTTLSERGPGDPVNLEVDMVARYLERLLAAGRIPPGGGVTESTLQEMGYQAE